ncbi:DUF4350 domain-containing protein [Pseudomonas sp. L-22-4S-12]|uniref:DUF4350 domain-containing protein n=1 Tax=Pseudomonas sp. L-22-4S-12 TaxID=2610893 RepID=UPI0013225C34|nr:DUF4350 domain-containing protein [Pseudomonas sp. L-22-4S-12]MWV17192.1 DUF4350 domain-containing protein [Pseudomonas sp. L-22-4S-12]
MSRTARFALGGLLVLALGLLAIYVLGQLQPYEKTLKLGPAPEVDADPYLAAEHFLRERKIAVSRADGLAVLRQLPAPGQTLMLLSSREDMTPRQARQVLEWTAKGGHLLFVAESLWDEEQGKSDDLLLDSLDIQQHLTEDLDEAADDEDSGASEADEQADADAGSAEDSDAAELDEEPGENQENLGEAVAAQVEAEDDDRYPELTKLYLENEEAPAYVDFDTDFHLYDAKNRAHAWANSGAATHMLQLYHGDGLVTVLTDAWLWQNDSIDAYDNAWLLWYLSQDSSVTLLYSKVRDSLLSQLFEHYPAALTALALLIALLLWHVGLRHGPLQSPPSHARRQLEEHLRGSADFLLRRTSQQHLLHSLQRDIQRRARHRHPGFERLAVADQWQVLGRLTRIPTSAISQAMRPVPAHKLSAADFTRQVANLQTLRNAL